MVKRFLRITLSILLTTLMVIGAGIYSGSFATVSAREVSPQFIITVDKTSASQGDTVAVTFYVTNPAEIPVTAFNGRLTFNKNYYEYMYFDYIPAMGSTVISFDNNEYITDNSVKFTYADTSGSTIPSGCKNVAFFKVFFRVRSDSPTGAPYFGGIIDSCYGTGEGGDVQFTSIPPVIQRSISIKATTTRTTSTTASTTASTSASTTTSTTATNRQSSDATLSSIQIAPGTLTPDFSTDTIAYTVSVENEVATIRIVATPSDNNAIVTGTGAKALSVGSNIFTLTVIAENGTTKQYGIVVIRADASDLSSELSSLESSSSTLELFSSDYSSETVSEESSELTEIGDKVGLSSASDDTSSTNSLKIVGIIFAEIALFFFGFLSGYYIDKGNKRKEAAYRSRSSHDRKQKRASYDFDDDDDDEIDDDYYTYDADDTDEDDSDDYYDD